MSQEATAIETRINKLFETAEAQIKVGTESALAEAEVALAMAHKLLTKHQLDEEIVRQKAQQAGLKFSQPVEKRFILTDGPYLKHRCFLATRIATSMGLRTRSANNGSYVVFLGFEDDCMAAWRIFSLVETQMMRAADLRVQRGEHKGIRDRSTKSGMMSVKTWKANYFNSYVNRIALRIQVDRLDAAEDVVFAEGYDNGTGQIVGRVTGALVLVDRQTAVEKFYDEKYPAATFKNGKAKKPNYWKPPQVRITNYDARDAGREDGTKARITQSAEIDKARGRLTV